MLFLLGFSYTISNSQFIAFLYVIKFIVRVNIFFTGRAAIDERKIEPN